jgi:hypothetical protein
VTQVVLATGLYVAKAHILWGVGGFGEGDQEWKSMKKLLMALKSSLIFLFSEHWAVNFTLINIEKKDLFAF